MVIAFFWGLYAYIRKRPISSNPPRVLVDKPPAEPPVDPAIKARDWSKRPCGSFLDWVFSRR
ncbi:MAG: hypothetical protein ACLQVY_00760 [Limisphaerales bacterium]